MKYIIHCEKLYDDVVWNNLTKFLRKHGKKTFLFLMAPQPTYLAGTLGYRGTKEELHKILTKRYKILAKVQNKYQFKVGLHLHLSLQPQSLSSKEKDHSLKYVYKWVSDIFQGSSVYQKDIAAIAFGWYKYDKYMEKMCELNNIMIVNDLWGYITFHDYDLPLNKKKVFEKWLRVVLRKLKKQKAV